MFPQNLLYYIFFFKIGKNITFLRESIKNILTENQRTKLQQNLYLTFFRSVKNFREYAPKCLHYMHQGTQTEGMAQYSRPPLFIKRSIIFCVRKGADLDSFRTRRSTVLNLPLSVRLPCTHQQIFGFSAKKSC